MTEDRGRTAVVRHGRVRCREFPIVEAEWFRHTPSRRASHTMYLPGARLDQTAGNASTQVAQPQQREPVAPVRATNRQGPGVVGPGLQPVAPQNLRVSCSAGSNYFIQASLRNLSSSRRGRLVTPAPSPPYG